MGALTEGKTIMPKENAANFGGRLRELREAAGLTQVQLAERVGLYSQGVVKLERGEREPAWATVIVLAEALGVDCRAFLQAPASISERKIGRPAKAPVTARASSDGDGQPPKKRGRPRKNKE